MKSIFSCICTMVLIVFAEVNAQVIASRSKQDMEAFEEKHKISQREAYLLARKIAKTHKKEHWIRRNPYLVDGWYFFPREVSKHSKIRDWGYRVHPVSGKVEYRKYSSRTYRTKE
ncbi:MAG: hypothetical protein ACPG32_15315 [Akkermansiaceae bacterium]